MMPSSDAEGNNADLFPLSDILLHFGCLFFFSLWGGKHRRFRRQSIISLSSIIDEHNELSLLSLSESITTLVAFFPTKGEIT